jgi:hypothetical protein
MLFELVAWVEPLIAMDQFVAVGNPYSTKRAS